MTDERELWSLIHRMNEAGAVVDHFRINGRFETISIKASGVGPHPMSPLAAAECMRRWLFKNERRR